MDGGEREATLRTRDTRIAGDLGGRNRRLHPGCIVLFRVRCRKGVWAVRGWDYRTGAEEEPRRPSARGGRVFQ